MTIVDGALSRDLERVLLDEATLAKRIAEIGAQITEDYAGREPLFIAILKGSFPFMADLVREVDLPLKVDFMALSSYGDRTKSTGVVKITKDLDRSMAGKHVIIVEDIIDTGLTLQYLQENLKTRQPASVEVCALLDKKAARDKEVPARYVGFECPDEFVVGYGLDYAGRYRNLPVVGVLKPSVYRSKD